MIISLLTPYDIFKYFICVNFTYECIDKQTHATFFDVNLYF